MSQPELPPTATLSIGSAGDSPFNIDANLLATGRTCVLGASGSGKSYTVAVICEELCKNNVPFALIDTEGEYSGLKEKYEAIWLGDDERCDLRFASLEVEEVARQAPDIAPLIVDLSEADKPKELVNKFLTELYRVVSEKRAPYLVVLEEADRFVPQQGERLAIFNEIARRGRKRGIGLMVCSQRPSLVDKNVLSQCGNQLIGKLIIQNDLKSVAQFFSGKGLPKQLTSLRPGEFYAMGGLSPEPVKVSMRQRETRHGGMTPVIASRVVRPFMGTLPLSSVPQMERQGQPGHPSAADRREPVEEKVLSFPTLIKEEDIPTIVKRRKSLRFFGKAETVTSVRLVLRPVVEVGVRLRRGVLKKRFETSYFHVDGVSGKLVELANQIREREGLERLLGLKTIQVEVLREIRPDYELSVLDLASKLQEPKAAMGKIVSALQTRRLVRVVEYGKKRLVRRVVDFPDVRLLEMPLELEEVPRGGAGAETVRLREDDVREIVRGIWEGADLDSFRVFHYPVYRVEMMLKRRKRFLSLDGRTAKELVL